MSTVKTVLGIAEMKVSNDPQEVLVTHSLGSCLGMTIYDPESGVGGMIHCMLPLSKIDPAKAKLKPAMFVDVGIPRLFKDAYGLGAKKGNIITKVAGCGDFMDSQSVFKIGQRNYSILKKLLWKNKIFIGGESVGGTISRTIFLQLETGKTILRCKGEEIEL